MFSFFKKRMRNEHLKLVGESSQMAKHLHKFYETHGNVMPDDESRDQARFMSELIDELYECSIWLENNDHLPPEKMSGLLDLYKALMTQVKQIEQGRNSARDLFE